MTTIRRLSPGGFAIESSILCEVCMIQMAIFKDISQKDDWYADIKTYQYYCEKCAPKITNGENHAV